MIDVTVPLQCLVKDSKLILTEATKVKQKTKTSGSLKMHMVPAALAGAAGS